MTTPATAPPSSWPRRPADLLDDPRLFHAFRFLLVGSQAPTRRVLREELSVTGGDVLDVCCGTGEFAQSVDAGYLGVDLNARFIARARARYRGRPATSFEVGDVTRLPFPDQHFAASMCVNSLHHFSDDAAAGVLREMRRGTRGRVLVVDADGTPRGVVRRALLALDRGRFMRTPARLAALVERVFAVETTRRWDVGLYTEVLFRCRPE
jgi:ubiquinone/menaquinone biosynthesis C-methylase UbiE